MNEFNWFTRKSIFIPSSIDLEVIELSFYQEEICENHLIQQNLTIPPNFSKMTMKRRNEYLAGRICTTVALKKLGIKDKELNGLTINSDRAPNFPDGIIGSITHTKDIAIACVAKSRTYANIGIDIEKIIDMETCKSIAKIIMTPYEIRKIESLNKLKIPYINLITLIFSAKESLFKALYKNVGYVFGFEVATIIRINDKAAYFTLKLENFRDKVFKVNYSYDNQYVYTSLIIKK
ncbi:4'-phosphopantetheinyl transferase family protein [Acinetobacter pollinis]|uniref:Enterobactin synthase component D n=1 Tax=Acinetobacter pollinis TaxID=2605270 RepID=A0ABU6DWP2_9GAMM|nr:4'-phosphopantetheinyl transferase superfamily protein [Acinetobacter pollinis]MEB5477848.1 4'-phosphopantetheinyl transferase superfamily protein [Acinetobacter pollinis]